MSSLKIIILPIAIIGAAVFLWISVKPLFTEAGKNLGVSKKKIENQIREERELQRRTDSLYEEQTDLRDQANPILNAVPGNEEIKNLLAQIEFVVQKEGMILSGVSTYNLENTAVTAPGVLVATKDYSEIEGALEVKGSYNQFKQLINSLEQLDRVINISNIEVKNGADSSGGVSGQFSIKFIAYYQPVITAEKMKAALEAKDVAN
jgi:Tfp pilus assembly protein PilO